jgi:alpha/beta superfamily hydrolase
MKTSSMYEIEDLAFKSSDGAKLVGEVFVPNKNLDKYNAIVCCHGLTVDRKRNYDLGKELGKNYLVYLFDLRAHGQSGGKFDGLRMVDDLLAAIDTVKEQYNVQKVGIFGHSLGALVSSLTACMNKEVEAAVLWSHPGSPQHFFEKTVPFGKRLYKLLKWAKKKKITDKLHIPLKFNKLKIDHIGKYLNEYVCDINFKKYLSNEKILVIQGERDLSFYTGPEMKNLVILKGADHDLVPMRKYAIEVTKNWFDMKLTPNISYSPVFLTHKYSKVRELA